MCHIYFKSLSDNPGFSSFVEQQYGASPAMSFPGDGWGFAELLKGALVK
jgi:hypothetical protein